MEPMLPSEGGELLAELSAEIFRRSGELTASLPSQAVRDEVARLVRGMNSYYSNLIEGHKTLPRDIEKALKNEFSPDGADRLNQQLSLAHIRAEQAMGDFLKASPETDVYSMDFICWLHREFFSHLPEDAWTTTSESGRTYPLEPGKPRTYNVEVGRHVPPDHPSIAAFMERFRKCYRDERILATNRVVALAAAHHRLVWIHPFGDGNGRVARLQSQAAMIRCGLGGAGLWTLSRGLAREKAEYHRLLQEADAPRRNDYDGRGNLSDAALSSFCVFFLRRMLDQMEFMISLVQPLDLVKRIENYLRFVRVDLSDRTREMFAKLLKALIMEGELTRGAVSGVVGLKDAAAREVIRKALGEGLIQSPSEKGVLRIAFPDKVVESYFPRLFTDLPVGP